MFQLLSAMKAWLVVCAWSTSTKFFIESIGENQTDGDAIIHHLAPNLPKAPVTSNRYE